MYQVLYLPCAIKLSLAQKIKQPNMIISPDQNMGDETLWATKKIKKPPIVKRVRTVPYTSRTYFRYSSEVEIRQEMTVLIEAKEKVIRTNHIARQIGKQLKTYLRVILFSTASSAKKTKAVTQITCPMRKANAPIANGIVYDPQRRHQSPIEPKNSPTITVLIWR